MDVSPEKALQGAGVISKEDMLKQILNGIKTITPIVAYMIKTETIDKPEAFNNILQNIKTIQTLLLKRAVESNYDVQNKHFVAMNRLALSIACTSEYADSNASNESIASLCAEIFDMDDIYAETLVDEYTEDEYALQFISISKIASVIVSYLIRVNAIEIGEEITNELLNTVIEQVDMHIDDIYEDFIEPQSSLMVRSNLLYEAASIIEAILDVELKKTSSSNINTPLILKKFEISYKTYVEAITMKAKMRGTYAHNN
jgi:hypothetical protein